MNCLTLSHLNLRQPTKATLFQLRNIIDDTLYGDKYFLEAKVDRGGESAIQKPGFQSGNAHFEATKL